MTPQELSLQGVEGVPYEQDYTSPAQGVGGVHYKSWENETELYCLIWFLCILLRNLVATCSVNFFEKPCMNVSTCKNSKLTEGLPVVRYNLRHIQWFSVLAEESDVIVPCNRPPRRIHLTTASRVVRLPDDTGKRFLLFCKKRPSLVMLLLAYPVTYMKTVFLIGGCFWLFVLKFWEV